MLFCAFVQNIYLVLTFEQKLKENTPAFSKSWLKCKISLLKSHLCSELTTIWNSSHFRRSRLFDVLYVSASTFSGSLNRMKIFLKQTRIFKAVSTVDTYWCLLFFLLTDRTKANEMWWEHLFCSALKIVRCSIKMGKSICNLLILLTLLVRRGENCLFVCLSVNVVSQQSKAIIKL